MIRNKSSKLTNKIGLLNELAVKRKTNYIKGKLIGKGKISNCFEFINQENYEFLAGKIIPKINLLNSKDKQNVNNEIEILNSINHENIISLKDSFEDDKNWYLITELFRNKTLQDLLNRRVILTELEVKYYIIQIINGIQYLHNRNIIHRNINLSNIFISDDMKIKLGGFSYCRKLKSKDKKFYKICGDDINYIAPEILEEKNGYSFEIDIWSLGIILYTLIIGKTPFETNEKEDTFWNIKHNNYSYPEDSKISKTAKNLITMILDSNQLQRPTLSQILSHSFLNDSKNLPLQLPKSALNFPPSLRKDEKYNNNYNIIKIKKIDTLNLDIIKENNNKKDNYIISKYKSRIRELEKINDNLNHENKTLKNILKDYTI